MGVISLIISDKTKKIIVFSMVIFMAMGTVGMGLSALFMPNEKSDYISTYLAPFSYENSYVEVGELELEGSLVEFIANFTIATNPGLTQDLIYNHLDALLKDAAVTEALYTEATGMGLSVEDAEVNGYYDNFASYIDQVHPISFKEVMKALNLTEGEVKDFLRKELVGDELLLIKGTVEDHEVDADYTENIEDYAVYNYMSIYSYFDEVYGLEGSEDNKIEVKDLAEEVLARLADGEDFEDLVKEYSTKEYRLSPIYTDDTIHTSLKSELVNSPLEVLFNMEDGSYTTELIVAEGVGYALLLRIKVDDPELNNELREHIISKLSDVKIRLYIEELSEQYGIAE